MQTPTPTSDAKKYSTFSCPHQHCLLFHQVGAGNLTHRSWTGKGKAIERLRCTICGQEFSERRGTLMEATKLSEDTIERLLKCQRWGAVMQGQRTSVGWTSKPSTGSRRWRPSGPKRIMSKSLGT